MVNRSITFVYRNIENILREIAGSEHGRLQKIIIRPFDDYADQVAKRVNEVNTEITVYAHDDDAGVRSSGVEKKSYAEVDGAVLLEQDGKLLTTLLMEFIDVKEIKVIAPVTERYFKNQPLFLISIPKSGSHLLYKLVEAFGFGTGIVFSDLPEPGNWYCVEFSNTHTGARDFFVDSVRRAHFGNRYHPFVNSPALFIYRNPLDILVSEANYYHINGKTAFAGYLSQLSIDDRIDRLIDDPWLLGSIRDRVGNYIPWLDFKNVVPVSFEELVGPLGGGDEEVQNDLLWSLQLKLHVPGNPGEFSKQIYDAGSHTYFKGQIGSYRTYMNDDHIKKFESLDQDFMKIFGYERADSDPAYKIPRRAGEFRQREILITENVLSDIPITVEYNYLSTNIVRYKGYLYAIPQAVGAGLDLREIPEELLNMMPRSTDIKDLKLSLLLSPEYIRHINNWQNNILGPALGGAHPAKPADFYHPYRILALFYKRVCGLTRYLANLFSK